MFPNQLGNLCCCRIRSPALCRWYCEITILLSWVSEENNTRLNQPELSRNVCTEIDVRLYDKLLSEIMITEEVEASPFYIKHPSPLFCSAMQQKSGYLHDSYVIWERSDPQPFDHDVRQVVGVQHQVVPAVLQELLVILALILPHVAHCS